MIHTLISYENNIYCKVIYGKIFNNLHKWFLMFRQFLVFNRFLLNTILHKKNFFLGKIKFLIFYLVAKYPGPEVTFSIN